MAEFTLPANSKVSTEGDHYAAAQGATRVKKFNVYRWNPEDVGADGKPKNPRIDTYEIDLDNCAPMVLDAL